MDKPAVEILLAVYNGERYLRQLLDSLVAQTFRDFRLVVSDNRSVDGTVAILDEYRSAGRLDIVLLPPPDETTSAHLNFARVTGAAVAPYVMYADADDVWHRDKIEKTFSAMRDAEHVHGDTAPILVHSDLAVVNEDLERIHSSFWRYQLIDPRRTGINQLLIQNCVTGCTTMLNRPLVELGKPVPPDARVHDYWFALVASAFGHIVAIDEPLIEYRQHGENVTGAKRWGLGYAASIGRRLYAGNGAREMVRRNITQAQRFLARFEDRLSPSQKRIIVGFATIGERNALLRRWRLFQFGFWKLGFMRNLGLFLVI